MFSRSKKFLVIVSVMIVSLLVFAGAALAQEPDSNATNAEGETPIQQMQKWMGAEGWGAMIQHMTDVHGAEATGEMLQEMNDGGSCHDGGFMANWGDMMGNWHGDGAWNGMMNGFRNMMGGGMMGSTGW